MISNKVVRVALILNIILAAVLLYPNIEGINGFFKISTILILIFFISIFLINGFRQGHALSLNPFRLCFQTMLFFDGNFASTMTDKWIDQRPQVRLISFFSFWGLTFYWWFLNYSIYTDQIGLSDLSPEVWVFLFK